MKKKILAIILVIFSFISGIFLGISYEKTNNKGIPYEIEQPIRPIVIEKEMDYFLYGCPNSKKIKKPIKRKKFLNIF